MNTMKKKSITTALSIPTNSNDPVTITLELIGLTDVDDLKIILDSFKGKKYVNLEFED